MRLHIAGITDKQAVGSSLRGQPPRSYLTPSLGAAQRALSFSRREAGTLADEARATSVDDAGSEEGITLRWALRFGSA